MERLFTTVMCLQDLYRVRARFGAIPVGEPATVRVYPIPDRWVTPKDPVGDRPLVSSTYTRETTARTFDPHPPEGWSSRLLIFFVWAAPVAVVDGE